MLASVLYARNTQWVSWRLAGACVAVDGRRAVVNGSSYVSNEALRWAPMPSRQLQRPRYTVPLQGFPRHS